ncbi:MAG: thymidine phosphorylase [Isosphaeraceae bacterium]|nr:MAG: thymidine phosphorylase [Isosphaeraceae bacterium]
MRAVELIRRKRDGLPLAPDEIVWLVRGIASGEVPDYQWAALLMAIVWRGLDDGETAALTQAMRDSGRTLDLSRFDQPKVDKHSTGGVGDKTSLILAPIVAACGALVPMISGRGLGHTGGTLDKLESIPGFNVRLSPQQLDRVLERCGLALAGQSDEIAPADRSLYALRDATATVESIPLITSSILSKKLAEGLDGLVLDVKTGDGAFFTEPHEARRLASTLSRIGNALGTRTVALLTSMDQPLGWSVGNVVEVRECLDTLRGSGPADLVELSLRLSAEMLVLAGIETDLRSAQSRARRALDDGSALERFRAVVEAQGGDPQIVDQPDRLPAAPVQHVVTAPRSGYLARLAARSIGHLTMQLGAGRPRVDSPIDHRVGLVLHRKLGEPIDQGEPLATIHAADPTAALHAAQQLLDLAIAIDDEPPPPAPLVLDRLA